MKCNMKKEVSLSHPVLPPPHVTKDKKVRRNNKCRFKQINGRFFSDDNEQFIKFLLLGFNGQTNRESGMIFYCGYGELVG
jgi:hypothetical protein